MRIAVLLGQDFCKWLFAKWQARWKNHAQPPSFYWTLKEMMVDLEKSDPRLVAGRFSATTKVAINGEEPITVREILDKPELAITPVSKACMKVFRGDKDFTSMARNLDYLAHGPEVQRRASAITKAVIKIVGDRQAGDIIETKESDI
jgi:hypothetical protein